MNAKRKIIWSFFLIALAVIIPLAVWAQTGWNKNFGDTVKSIITNRQNSQNYKTVTLAATDTVNDNYFRIADKITIDGNVNGDVILLAGEAVINGQVSGDVLAAAGTLVVNGQVGGNIRAAAGEITINNTVGKNITILAGTATLTDQAAAGWSLAFAGGEIKVNCPVAGNIYGFGGQINLNNTIGTNVTVFLDTNGQVNLDKKTVINGNFTYRGDNNANIATTAVIKGETIHQSMPVEVSQARKFLSTAGIYGKIISLLSFLLVGTLAISVFEDRSRRIIKNMWENPGLKMLWGFLFLIATPIAAVIIALTVIGFPLALMLMALYLFFLYLTTVFVGLLIGRKILIPKEPTDKKELPLIWMMMLGVLIYFILTRIPYVGWIFSLIGTVWFLGTMWEIILASFRKNGAAGAAMPKEPVKK